MQPSVLTDDGGWCWFESPRALLSPPWLLVGSVASGHRDASRRGNVELIAFSTEDSSSQVVVLHGGFELDDHDCPAIHHRLCDRRFLTTWAKHGTEATRYYRLSLPDDPLHWEEIRTFTPSATTQLTYSNLLYLSAERRLYDFYRGLHGSFKPSYALSSDEGATWETGNVVIEVPSAFKHRPYVKYASNGLDTVHLIYSEAHPRDFDNSLYHVEYRGGGLLTSDSQLISALTTPLSSPDAGTRIYEGDAQHVAWPVDVVLHDALPTVVFSVQHDSAGLPVGQGGENITYRYACWQKGDGGVGGGGGRWHEEHLAFAGCRLYSGEDDYSGLVALEPEEAGLVYASTNSHPATGEPLLSKADGKRHWELWTGRRRQGAEAVWDWTPLTADSSDDQLRPIRVPGESGGPRWLLWLRGEYRSWVDYTQAIVAVDVRGR